MAHHDTLTQDVKTKVEDLGNDLVNAGRAKATEAAHAARDQAVNEASRFANAADAAASEFSSDSVQAQLASQVANQAERLAKSVSELDVNALSRDISDFARRNPLIFIGGAAMVGLVAARFLKARDRYTSEVPTTFGDEDPWQTRRAAPVGGGLDVQP